MGQGRYAPARTYSKVVTSVHQECIRERPIWMIGEQRAVAPGDLVDDNVRVSARLCLLVVAGGLACRRGVPPAPAAPAPPLPEVPGFLAGPVEQGPAFARRTYQRGSARIDVTLARFPMAARAYTSWVTTSVASYPQATLDVDPGQGNGFYQCTDGTPPSCDLLIQLRAGAHLELRGGRTSRKEDVDALAAGLPLRQWAARATERDGGG
jgi:hypothetical protein